MWTVAELSVVDDALGIVLSLHTHTCMCGPVTSTHTHTCVRAGK